MMEVVWWFIFKDSRVPFRMLRENSTKILIGIAIFSIAFSLRFISVVNTQIFHSLSGNLTYGKFILELVVGFAVLPFLILKSSQRYQFDPKNKADKFKLKNYLHSRM